MAWVDIVKVMEIKLGPAPMVYGSILMSRSSQGLREDEAALGQEAGEGGLLLMAHGPLLSSDGTSAHQLLLMTPQSLLYLVWTLVVPAACKGRGFHWQSGVRASVPGDTSCSDV